MTLLGTAGVAAAVVSGARAQVAAIPPFVGSHREGFEGRFPLFFEPQLTCFGSHATASQLGGTIGVIVGVGFGSACGTMQEHSGIQCFIPWLDVDVEWTFDQPARRFGGYFGTICQDPGATAEFYDESGALIAALPLACPTAGQWAWNGWTSKGPRFKRVRILAADPDGHVLHDDMELDFGGCYADCDASGALALDDFACFQSWFAASDPRADCTNNGALTIADFACFQWAFFQGCP